MEITEVRIKPVSSEGRLLAFASITIDDCFAVHNLKVIDGRDGLFVAMPSRRLLDGSLSALFGNKQELCRMVISAFAEDPEEDFPRFIGLLLWLAWDSSLDARTAMQDKTDREDLHACAHELAGLVQLFLSLPLEPEFLPFLLFCASQVLLRMV